MGFYTDIDIDLLLKKETPAEVVDTLKSIVDRSAFDNRSKGRKTPDHPLFRCQRWDFMFGNSGSHPQPHRSFEETAEGWRLKVGSSFKNYDGEIVKLADWLLPWVVPQEEPFLRSKNEESWHADYYTDGRTHHHYEDPYDDYPPRHKAEETWSTIQANLQLWGAP